MAPGFGLEGLGFIVFRGKQLSGHLVLTTDRGALQGAGKVIHDERKSGPRSQERESGNIPDRSQEA